MANREVVDLTLDAPPDHDDGHDDSYLNKKKNDAISTVARDRPSRQTLVDRVRAICKGASRPPLSKAAVGFYDLNTEKAIVAELTERIRLSDIKNVWRPPAPSKTLLIKIARFLLNHDNFENAQTSLGDACFGFFYNEQPSVLSFLRLLSPDGWLDSTAVNLVGILLEKKTSQRVLLLPDCYWTATGDRTANIRRPDFPPQCQLILTPINMGTLHWTLLVADAVQNRIRFFDSFHKDFSTYCERMPIIATRFAAFKAYLAAKFPSKTWDYDVRNMHHYGYKYPGGNWAKQEDSSSCGIYVARSMEYVTASKWHAFAQASWDSIMPLLRLRYIGCFFDKSISSPIASPSEVTWIRDIDEEQSNFARISNEDEDDDDDDDDDDEQESTMPQAPRGMKRARYDLVDPSDEVDGNKDTDE